MRIDQAIIGKYQENKIEKVYYKNYKLFDYDEIKMNRPCYLEFPLKFNNNDILSDRKLGYLNKMEFIYYEDFNAKNFDYNSSKNEFLINLLDKENGNNTFKDYFLNPEHTVFFQVTYDQQEHGCNFYIIGLTKNIIIKNNNLSFRYIPDYRPNKTRDNFYCSFKKIKFNDVLHLENPNVPVDLSYCFFKNTYLQYIEDFEKIGIKQISNLESICEDDEDFISGLNPLFESIEPSYIKSMKHAFYMCENLSEELYLMNINLANNCDPDALNSTFYWCRKIKLSSNQIRHFDFTKLTSLSITFYECSFYEKTGIVNFSNLDFSNIIDISGTFGYIYTPKNYQITFENSIFPDVEDLSLAFTGLDKKANFSNIFFPKGKEFFRTFNGTTPINFDLDTNIFNNPLLEDVYECFAYSDLTDYDANILLQKALNLSSTINKQSIYSGSHLNSFNFNNTTFTYNIIQTDVYWPNNPTLFKYRKYQVPDYDSLLTLSLIKNANIDIVNMNNCVFQDPTITLQTDTDYIQKFSDDEFPYLNYFDVLFNSTNIKTLNINNCAFGENLVPYFCDTNINILNMNNAEPYIINKPLRCGCSFSRKEQTSFYKYISHSMLEWSENLFENIINELHLQNFQFYDSLDRYIFGKCHIAIDTLEYKTTGLYSPTLRVLDLSNTNISALYLEKLQGYIDSGKYKEHIYKCNLNQLLLSNINNNSFLYFDDKIHTNELDLSNNNLNYNYFVGFLKDTLDTLNTLDISNTVITCDFSESLEIKWLCMKNLYDTGLSITFPDPIQSLTITKCNLDHLNLNTLLNGQISNSINILTYLNIYNNQIKTLTLLNTSKMNFLNSVLRLSKNSLLESVNFIDNNTFACQGIDARECSTITSSAVHNIFEHINCINISSLFFNFRECGALTSCDFTKLNNINSNQTIQAYDTNNHMFYDDQDLISVNFGPLTLYSPISMFDYCRNLTNVNINNLVGDASYIFNKCHSLSTINVINWNPTKLTGAFYDCQSLTSINFINSNMSNLRYMSHIFSGCDSLTSIDLSSWNTSNLLSATGSFNNCFSLTSIDLSSWDTSVLQSTAFMFYGCTALTSVNLSSWNTSNLFDISSMFEKCTSLISLDLSDWNGLSFTSCENTFKNCISLRNLELFSFPTYNPTTGPSIGFRGMFFNCSSLTQLDLNNFYCYLKENQYESESGKIYYIYEGTIIPQMFQGCKNLQTIYTNNHNHYVDIIHEREPGSVDPDPYWRIGDTFYHCNKLVGENGTAHKDQVYDEHDPDGVYFAKIDGGENDKGYFTYQASN